MDEEIRKLIEKYRRLPAFLQRRAYYNVISKIPKNEYGFIDNEVLKEIVHASKKRIKYDTYNKCKNSAGLFWDSSLFGDLDLEDQRIVFGDMKLMDRGMNFKYLKDVEIKEQLLQDMFYAIQNDSFDPNDTFADKKMALPIFKQMICSEDENGIVEDFISQHADQIYELFKDYPGDKYDFVYKDAMTKIIRYLDDSKKREVFPRILKADLSDDLFSIYELCKAYKYLPDVEQERYFEKIVDRIKEKDEYIGMARQDVASLVRNTGSRTQARTFSKVLEFGKDTSFIDFDQIWCEYNKHVQRMYYRQVLTPELWEKSKWEYCSIYGATAGKLQSEILNERMFESFKKDDINPTEDFSRLLRSTSKEVYEKNFKYFFNKMKDRSGYRSLFLLTCNNQVLEKNAETIRDYYVDNVEKLIEEGYYREIIQVAKTFNEDVSIDLFNALNEFSQSQDIVTDQYGNEINIEEGIIDIFATIGEDKQSAIIDKLFEKKDFTCINSLFNGLNAADIDKQINLIERYLAKNDLPKEVIQEKVALYKKLHEKNSMVSSTLNLDFLSTDLTQKFDFPQLLQLTNYRDVQKFVLKYKDNKGFISTFSNILESDENWTILADTILNNIRLDESFNTVLDNIEDMELTPEESRNLTKILSGPNYFDVKTYEDVRDFDKPHGIRDTICERIFNGDYSNLPEKLAKMSPEELKRFAISEYIFGSAYDSKFKTLFSDGIELMQEIDENPDFNKRLARAKKLLATYNTIGEAKEDELDEMIAYIHRNKAKVERYDILELESKVINLFGESIGNSLYKPSQNQDQYVGTETYVNGKETKEIPIYRIQRDFDAIVRVEGAYSASSEPDDYKEYFNQPNITYHGNCSSIVGNDLIALARNHGTDITVGYEEVPNNGLLLMGPYDLSSGKALQSIAPYNLGAYRQSRFLDTQRTKNETRHTHNEIALERVLVSSDGSVKKLEPSYLLWVEEEKEEVFPPLEFEEPEGRTLEEEEKEAINRWKRWEKTKKAAADLGIPIVVINRERMAERETEKLESLEKIISGEEPMPENESMASIMEKALINMENNSNSLRFTNKLKDRYYTSATRERLNDTIVRQIDALMITNPEEALECVQAVSRKYEYENRESEDRSIEKFYDARLTEMHKKEDELRKYLGIDSDIQFEMTEQSKSQFENDIEEINKTDHYSKQRAHSIEHIEKVMLFSQILSQNEGLDDHSSRILLAAAAFHDSSRNGEDGNVEHAREGAITAGEFFESHPDNPYGIKDEDIPMVQVAIAYHEYVEPNLGEIDKKMIHNLCAEYGVKKEDYSKTEKIAELLKDADALDRERFANKAKLNPKLLRSKTAKSHVMIDFAKRVNEEYAQKVLGLNYGGRTNGRDAVEKLREKRIEGIVPIEKKVPTSEMVEMFSDMTKGKIRQKITDRKKHRCLLINYGESEITNVDVAKAQEMVTMDAARSNPGTVKSADEK